MILDQGGRARRSTSYPPVPRELRPFVVEAWVQRYPLSCRDAGSWRIVPDLQPHLLAHGGPDGTAGVPRLVGARSVYVDRPAARRSWTVGVTLRPGVLPALTGRPASELLDRSATPGTLLGPPGRHLDEAVVGLPGPDRALAALLTFLGGALDPEAPGVDWRVRGFLDLAARQDRPRVGGIARTLGVSPRSLRESLVREVGLSPRSALTIRRVHRVLRRVLRRGPPRWSEVGRAAGYYDQPHLIRDFNRLLGETPTAFRRRGRLDA